MTQAPSPFRLIATDVDGTLIGNDKRVPRLTKDELQRVTRDYGLSLLLVSTRMPSSLVRVCDELAIECPLIAYNGSIIIPTSGEPPIYSTAIDDLVAGVLIRELLLLNVHVGAFSGDRWFVSDNDYWTMREVRGTGVWPEQMNLRQAISGGAVLPVNKIMVRGDAKAVGEAIKAVELLRLNVGISRDSRDTVVEFTNSSVSKGAALQKFLDFVGLPSASVIAFGDSYNDLSMLKLAGKGVAVDNAPEEVRSVADETTRSNDEGGVGYSLRKYFPAKGLALPSAD
jgi:Cof subfamily protein (haloacid dehalogenase superfamily)